MSKNKKETNINNATELEEKSSSDFVVQESKKENKDNANNKANKAQNKNKSSNKKKTNVNNEKRTLGQKTRATVSELKKVTWPTFGQTLKQTGVVIGFVLVFVAILLGLNSLFGWLFNLIVSSL